MNNLNHFISFEIDFDIFATSAFCIERQYYCIIQNYLSANAMHISRYFACMHRCMGTFRDRKLVIKCYNIFARSIIYCLFGLSIYGSSSSESEEIYIGASMALVGMSAKGLPVCWNASEKSDTKDCFQYAWWHMFCEMALPQAMSSMPLP